MAINKTYIDLKNKIIKDLSSPINDIEHVKKIPDNEEEFTYKNGIQSWICGIFVDIRNSSDYFKNVKHELIARILRSYYAEIIGILKSNDLYRQIGIRGDCIFAAYTTPYQKDLEDVLSLAIQINTFNIMFQEILKKLNFPRFLIGIGLGAAEDLVVKIGQKGTSINDYVWIGKSIVNASNNSSLGNKNGYKTIVLDSVYYHNIKDFPCNSDHNYDFYFNKHFDSRTGEFVFDCDIVKSNFYEWIMNGMKDE